MKLKDKVKESLVLCRDGKCEGCKYNGWIPEVCRKVLLDDTLKVIKELEQPIQLIMDIPLKEE